MFGETTEQRINLSNAPPINWAYSAKYTDYPIKNVKKENSDTMPGISPSGIFLHLPVLIFRFNEISRFI